MGGTGGCWGPCSSAYAALRGGRARVGRDRLRELEALVDGRVRPAPELAGRPPLGRRAAELVGRPPSRTRAGSSRAWQRSWDALVARLTAGDRHAAARAPSCATSSVRTRRRRRRDRDPHRARAPSASRRGCGSPRGDARVGGRARGGGRGRPAGVEGLRDFQADSKPGSSGRGTSSPQRGRPAARRTRPRRRARRRSPAPTCRSRLPLPADLAGELDAGRRPRALGRLGEAEDAVQPLARARHRCARAARAGRGREPRADRGARRAAPAPGGLPVQGVASAAARGPRARGGARASAARPVHRADGPRRGGRSRAAAIRWACPAEPTGRSCDDLRAARLRRSSRRRLLRRLRDGAPRAVRSPRRPAPRRGQPRARRPAVAARARRPRRRTPR